jgi:hypothetical protein
MSAPTPAPARLTINILAQARGLDPDTLRKLGWIERPDGVAIPWPLLGGGTAWHVRHLLGKGEGKRRWSWQNFDRARILPYGHDRLARMREQSPEALVVVESETDAACLWSAGIAALATAGADMWRREWWALTQGFGKVVLWLEDAGSVALLRAMAATRPNDAPPLFVCHGLGQPGGAKDPGRILASLNGAGHEALRRIVARAVPVTRAVQGQGEDELLAVVAERLAARRSGSGYEARCPFHSDDDPSLSVFRGADGWGFRCHSGICGAKGPLSLLAGALGIVPLGGAAAIPDSRSLNASGIGNVPATAPAAWQPVAVAELQEPAARAWLVPGLLPVGCLSLWYGDAGTYKTWLAIALAVAVAAGRRFLDHPVPPGRVLYLDAELDTEEFARRAYAVCRGIGLPRPPEGLYYLRLPQSLAAPEALDRLAAAVAAVAPSLVILDSLTLAAPGADFKEAGEVLAVLDGLKRLGTVLALDHIPKPPPGVNQSALRPYGSFSKWAYARHVVQLLRGEGDDGLVLRPAKANFARLAEPVGVALDFTFTRTRPPGEPGEMVVAVRRVDLADGALAGIDALLPARERVARALAEHPDGVTPVGLAAELELSEKTVRNHLTALHRHGRAAPVGAGRWLAVASSLTTTPPPTPAPAPTPAPGPEGSDSPAVPEVPDSRSIKGPGIGNGAPTEFEEFEL